MKQKCLLALFVINLIIVFASCNVMLANSQIDLNRLKGFKCFGSTKIKTPIRLTQSGAIECFSLDGRDCSSGFTNDHECRAYVSEHKKKVLPVKCTKADYKNKNHWCKEAKKYFFKKCHCPWETGLSVAIKFSKKEWKVKCLSMDGKKCLKDKAASKMCKKANSCKETRSKIRPKTCTKAKNTFAGDNWCKKGYAYFKHSGKFVCKHKTGVDMALRVSRNGNVQCLSHDGKNCIKGLDTVEKCAAAVLKETDGGFKKPVKVSCGEDLKSKTGDTGFGDKNTWCSKGYKYLYKRDGKKPDPVVEKVKRRVRKNFVPKWFRALTGFFRKPAARTRRGLGKVKRVLARHGFKATPEKWRRIRSLIRAGVGKSRQGLRKLVKMIKKNTPALRYNKPLPPRKIKAKIKFPAWFRAIKKIVTKPIAKTKKGLTYIRNVLTVNKFKFTPKRWKGLKKNIISGKFKKVISSIKKNTPALRKIIQARKNVKKGKKVPKWFSQFKIALRHPKSRSDKGLKIIKNVLRKNGFHFTPQRWNKIKTSIQSGKVLFTPKTFRKIVKLIKNNTPSLGGRKRSFRRGVYLNVEPGKKCGKKFFKKLKKLLKRKNSKTKKGLRKIKNFLKNHFEMSPEIWQRIKESIINGTLRTARGRKVVTRSIKKVIPKKNLAKRKAISKKNKPFRTSGAKRRLKKVTEIIKKKDDDDNDAMSATTALALRKPSFDQEKKKLERTTRQLNKASIAARKSNKRHHVKGSHPNRRHHVGGKHSNRRHHVGGKHSNRRHHVKGSHPNRRHHVGGKHSNRRHNVG